MFIFATLRYTIFQFVISVSFRNIQSVPFPAVTVCQPGSGKWSAIVEALSQVDKDDSIFETIQKFEEDFKLFSNPFNDYFATQWTMLVDGAVPNEKLDHKIPAVLNLLPVEKEFFYLIHFACFAMGKTCEEEIIRPSNSLALKSILRKDTREQTVAELEEMICNKVNCSIKNDSNWMNCNNGDENQMYQQWCEECPNLSGCLSSRSGYGDVYMVSDIVRIFYAWRKFFTRKNFIHALLTFLLDDSYQMSLIKKLRLKVWARSYLEGINPFPNSNLTLLDAWSYAHGDLFERNTVQFTSQSIEALKSCLMSKDEASCHLVERFNQELGKENINLWKDIHGGLPNDFIPLCSYGATNNELFHCAAFKKIDQDRFYSYA